MEDGEIKLSFCSVMAELCRWDVKGWERNRTGDCLIVRCWDADDAQALGKLFECPSKGKKAFIPLIPGVEYAAEEQPGQQLALL